MSVEPTWERVEKPILAALAEANQRPQSGAQLKAATGLDTPVLMRSLRSLKEDGYIAGVLMTADEADHLIAADGIRLAPKGLREVHL